MKDVMDKVREFHRKFGLPIETRPIFPSKERRILRGTLIAEEHSEYFHAERRNDMVEIADAMGEMIVVIAGTAIEYGIPLDVIFNEIHKANMAKLDANGKPIKRYDGKILKPVGWTPPNIRRILYDK